MTERDWYNTPWLEHKYPGRKDGVASPPGLPFRLTAREVSLDHCISNRNRPTARQNSCSGGRWDGFEEFTPNLTALPATWHFRNTPALVLGALEV